MVDLSRFLIVFVPLVVALLISLRRMGGYFFCRVTGRDLQVPSRANRIIASVSFTVSAVGLVGFGWALYEPYLPEVAEVRITTPKLTSPVRIVQLSDFHSDPTVRLEDEIPGIVRKLKPDLIVFTGDAINSSGGLQNFQRCMKQLAAIAPTFGVDGNWEVWWFKEIDIFEDTGVQRLDGTATELTVGSNRLWVAGSRVESEKDTWRMLSSLPKDTFRIFLHHYPCIWTTASGAADLHLAGDTHGGQIVLPLLGPLVRIARYDREFYQSGLQRRGNIWLYVNRGIGMEGGLAPRVRFNCRPEITLIELLPEK